MGTVESQKQLYQKNPGNIHPTASLPRHTLTWLTSPSRSRNSKTEYSNLYYEKREETVSPIP